VILSGKSRRGVSGRSLSFDERSHPEIDVVLTPRNAAHWQFI